MLAWIDIGYNAAKAVAGKRRVACTSTVGSPDRGHFSLSDGNTSPIVLLAPSHVLISNEAVQQSCFIIRSKDRRWTISDKWLFLFLATLTELTLGTITDVELVTGLPVAFCTDREQMLHRLIRERRVQRDSRREQLLRVTNARVIPQPFGSLLHKTTTEIGRA